MSDLPREISWVGAEHADQDGFINSYRFMDELQKYFRPNEVVVTDMGQHSSADIRCFR